ncbi:GNAT family N-acetyltransferase [Gudongella sp. SC589]|uniref:GNAT family N-acetyltransferase n=1 Tax=Gudongella sp. SC589 TaxID=3385990 RepID=UPI003904DB1F
MDVRIRKVTEEDLEEVVSVEAECFPQAEAATRESLENRIRTFPDSFFAAEADNRIIGFVNGCVTDERTIRGEMFSDSNLHNPQGDYQAIFGLDVIPEYQRQGIAAMLMEHMIEESKKSGRKGVILTCKDKLIKYYEKFGFENLGVSDSQHGGATWYDMILEFRK